MIGPYRTPAAMPAEPPPRRWVRALLWKDTPDLRHLEATRAWFEEVRRYVAEERERRERGERPRPPPVPPPPPPRRVSM